MHLPHIVKAKFCCVSEDIIHVLAKDIIGPALETFGVDSGNSWNSRFCTLRLISGILDQGTFYRLMKNSIEDI
ncbi:hypothetical protein ACHQM5_028002 [Ranunculus cassubicifolius]